MRNMCFAIFAVLMALPAWAGNFQKVQDRPSFVSLMDGRTLTRFGIRLSVTPDGRIIGRAFGRDVTGAWQWRAGYFCRDLYWGSQDLGPNCQSVKVHGQTVRFISDRGSGQYADLTLR